MNKLFQVFTLAIFIILSIIEPVLASPGGAIASIMFQSFLGKIILSLLIIFFFPIILYTILREYLAQKKTVKDLNKLASINKLFNWLTLQDRIIESFYKVHNAWRIKDMRLANFWMNNWYGKNQQIILNKWFNEGLNNRCYVSEIINIKPLFLAYQDCEDDVEGSKIVVSITANMEDYLIEEETNEIIEGKEELREIETVWTFIIKNNHWVVSNIEEDTLSLDYAQLSNELPIFLETYKTNKEGKVF